MKISLITVTYNSAGTLEDTILSVLSQDHADLEYIVVDGGSTDGTLQIIEKFRHRITKFVTGKDNGIYDALNKGIAMATGEVTGILHSDDFFTGPSVLASYAGMFAAGDCDAVYADLHYVARNNPAKIIRRWTSGIYSPGAFLRGWMPPHPTFFVRTALYRKYGAFDLRLKSAADYELMLRFIHRYGIRLCYLKEVTVKMRVGGKSNVTFRNRIKANLEDRLAWKLNGLRPGALTLFMKPFRKLLQFF